MSGGQKKVIDARTAPGPCYGPNCDHVSHLPTGAELEALSGIIMRAESDEEHWPFPVRRLSPFEMARVILKAGYRKDHDESRADG